MSTNTLPVAPFLHQQEHAVPLRVVEKPKSQRERLLAMARATAPKAPSKSSSGHTPALHVVEAEALTEAFPKLYTAKEDSERRYRECCQAIITMSEPRRIALAREMGSALSSVKINGILYVFAPPHHTKALRSDRLDAAMEAFGERFEEYFVPRLPKAELRPDQTAALEAAGVPYDVEYVGTDAFHAARTLDAGVELASAAFPELTPIQSVRLK